MNPEVHSPDTNGDAQCVVCGKDMAGTRASALMYVEGRPLPVCCPLCLDAYQKAPERFARRASAQEALREAQRLLGLKDTVW